MTNAEAIHALAGATGLDGLSLDGDECEIVLDGDLSVTLCGEPRGEALEVVIPLMDSGSAGGVERAALEASFLGLAPAPAWIGIDPLTGEIALRSRLELSHVPPEAVADRVAALAATARRLRDGLPGLRRTEAAPMPDDPDVTMLRL